MVYGILYMLQNQQLSAELSALYIAAVAKGDCC